MKGLKKGVEDMYYGQPYYPYYPPYPPYDSGGFDFGLLIVTLLLLLILGGYYVYTTR